MIKGSKPRKGIGGNRLPEGQLFCRAQCISVNLKYSWWFIGDVCANLSYSIILSLEPENLFYTSSSDKICARRQLEHTNTRVGTWWPTDVSVRTPQRAALPHHQLHCHNSLFSASRGRNLEALLHQHTPHFAIASVSRNPKKNSKLTVILESRVRIFVVIYNAATDGKLGREDPSSSPGCWW